MCQSISMGTFLLNKENHRQRVRVHMPVVIIVLTFKTSYINCSFCLNLRTTIFSIDISDQIMYNQEGLFTGAFIAKLCVAIFSRLSRWRFGICF